MRSAAGVPTIARTPSSQVALLVQLKIVQAVGRFLPVEEIPQAAIEHVARELGVDEEIRHLYSDSTLYRHHSAVLERLRITAWGAAARELARRTMVDIAQVRTDPADLINAAVDALVRHRFELPSLDTLTRLARRVHSQVNTAQWQRVGALLKEVERAALEALLARSIQPLESSALRGPEAEDLMGQTAAMAATGRTGRREGRCTSGYVWSPVQDRCCR